MFCVFSSWSAKFVIVKTLWGLDLLVLVIGIGCECNENIVTEIHVLTTFLVGKRHWQFCRPAATIV